MTRPQHSSELLASLQQGEVRLVYAVDVRFNPPKVETFPDHLVHASPDVRTRYRDGSRGALRCIVPECRAALVPHFRTARRPGWQHSGGAADPDKHQPETQRHELAKAMIAQWVQSRHPGLQVVPERLTQDKTRRPDVTITGATHRVLVEVQYSSDGREWEQRTKDLQRDQVASAADRPATVVWLLGWGGEYGRYRNGRLQVHEVVRRMCAAGHIPLWVDPESRRLVTAWAGQDEHGPLDLREAASTADLVDHELDECDIKAEGIITPKLVELWKARDARAAAAARVAQQRARAEAARRQVLARRMEAWHASSARAWVRQRHSDGMPGWLTAWSPCQSELAEAAGLTVEHWKTLVYQRLATEAPAGWVGFSQLLTVVLGPRGRNRQCYTALREHLRRMCRAEVLELQEDGRGVQAARMSPSPAPPEPVVSGPDLADAALPNPARPSADPLQPTSPPDHGAETVATAAPPPSRADPAAAPPTPRTARPEPVPRHPATVPTRSASRGGWWSRLIDWLAR